MFMLCMCSEAGGSVGEPGVTRKVRPPRPIQDCLGGDVCVTSTIFNTYALYQNVCPSVIPKITQLDRLSSQLAEECTHVFKSRAEVRLLTS